MSRLQVVTIPRYPQVARTHTLTVVTSRYIILSVTFQFFCFLLGRISYETCRYMGTRATCCRQPGSMSSIASQTISKWSCATTETTAVKAAAILTKTLNIEHFLFSLNKIPQYYCGIFYLYNYL